MTPSFFEEKGRSANRFYMGNLVASVRIALKLYPAADKPQEIFIPLPRTSVILEGR